MAQSSAAIEPDAGAVMASGHSCMSIESSRRCAANTFSSEHLPHHMRPDSMSHSRQHLAPHFFERMTGDDVLRRKHTRHSD